MDINRLVKAYINLRDARSDLKKKYEEDDKVLSDKMDMVSAKLLEIADENGLSTMKTAAGTVSRRVTHRYYPSDWDSFFNYMREFGPVEEMLEKRLAQNNFKQFLEEHPDAKPPVNSDSKYVISVRRS